MYIFVSMYVKAIIYSLYEIFTKSVTGDGQKWTPNEADSKCVDRFIARWDKRGVKKESLGVGFLYDYFCDSYNMWTRKGEDLKLIPLNHIIGDPQLKRWDNRHKEYQYLYTVGFRSKVKIPSLTEMKMEIFPPVIREDNIAEEYERQRFHNTAEGFMNCILITSMCDPKSKSCNICSSRDGCIEELKIRDKSTALKRGFIKL